MLEKLKEGYIFFTRYDEGILVATLTLKDEDIYKDVVKINSQELEFLNKFDNINKTLSNDIGLSIVYDSEEKKYVSSIKSKTTIGEYNDNVVWNNKVSGMGIDFMDSLSNLDRKLLDDKERSVL